MHEGYLCKHDDGHVLGEQVGALCRRNAGQALLPKIRPVLRALRDETRGAAHLSLYSGGDITLVDIADRPDTPSVDLWVGVQEAAHATAFGKCVLSCLDVPARRDYLARYRLVGLTPHTMTDARVLEQRLPQCGDAFQDSEEYLLGTACLATPVRAPGIIGAIEIWLPSRRLHSAQPAPLQRASQGALIARME